MGRQMTVRFRQTVGTEVGGEPRTFDAGREYRVGVNEIAHLDPASFDELERDREAPAPPDGDPPAPTKKKTADVKGDEKRTTDLN